MKIDFNRWTRWLHIYLSLFSFATLLFFSITGITLNHPEWSEGRQRLEKREGKFALDWIATDDSLNMRKLEIVEHLRNTHNIKARLIDFRVDEYECSLSFKGPGYVADVFIERSSGSYELIITTAGTIAIMNDLHKGRDTGSAWALAIDISAILMIIVSLTGFIVVFFIKKKKSNGLLLAFLGTVILVILYFIFAR